MFQLLSRSSIALAALFVLNLVSRTVLAAVPPGLHLTSYVSGLKDPVAIESPRDGSGRMFVVERGGTLRVVVNDALQSEPYYKRAVDTGDVERGLLGLAFDPEFKTNGTLYITYTMPGASGEILLRLVAKDPAANVFSGDDSEVMTLPLFYNHNGGDIHFGPDKYLYWSTGSGTGSFDPENLAQDLWKKDVGNRSYSLMGKILRLDVRKPGRVPSNACGSQGKSEYSIPADNPYATTDDHCAEIWLYGFRNPWRFSFDRENGDLWIGDVGEGAWEEVDLRKASDTGNRNYGYPQCEGMHHGRPAGTGATCPAETGTVGPVMEYGHEDSRCSLTGGVRYRGPITALQGKYVFGDACTSELFIGSESGGAWAFEKFASGIKPGYGTIASFGEGEDGTLYVVDHLHGEVLRVDSKSAGKEPSAMRERTLHSPIVAAALFVLNFVSTPAVAGVPPDVHLTTYISSGLTEPVAIRSPRDGSGRMFVVERGGALRVVNANGVLLGTPYYTRSVDTGDVERGLLGLAFDPDFETNGTLYIVYTASGASGEI
ncbi:MAG: PQQ-dependent sugar dehydrogenase, partial [Rhodanobacteraceae bacterium]